jgi:hypothetical protein
MRAEHGLSVVGGPQPLEVEMREIPPGTGREP